MKKILLMGNPNVGKSAFFSRLTGVEVITSNYPGTTVEYTRGYALIAGEKYEVLDVPGTYTLEPTCKAEEIAREMLKEAVSRMVGEADIVINIVDATNLERNLYLTLELLERPLPVIVALNLWDEARHHGIEIDVEKLKEWLRVPVVPTVAVTGEGFIGLNTEIYKAYAPRVRPHSAEERLLDVGKLVKDVQTIHYRRHTLRDRLEELTVHQLTGLPIALLVMVAAFFVIRQIGEGLIGYLLDPAFENFYTPLLMKLSGWLGGAGFWHDLLVGHLIASKVDYLQSFGLLSTAIYIEIGAVLPYIIAFYLVLGILEDSGYLPRLAVLMDNLLHRIGLHGFAIVPTLLAFGCNVPGIMATRILESRRERFIAATLISIGVPCAALQAMIIGVLGKHGGGPIAIVYAALFGSWFILGFILNRLLPGFSPELLLEIPPYRLPPLRLLFKKLWWRVKAFLKEALPIVMLGVLAVDLLYLAGVFNLLIGLFAPVMRGLLGLPKEAVTAIIIGFLRKDVAVGLLLPLGLSVKQLIVGCVVLSMFFPCVATFVVLCRELGWRDMLKSTAIMIAAALAAGGLLNLVL
ncbi:MAG: ferrous iron transporter B [Candidatus Saganbacteria bacterium]|nr:ferrous iron transporter B [Candidatus Saganbacteria bacterium]